MADKRAHAELFQLYQEINWQLTGIDWTLWRGCRARERHRLEAKRHTLEERQLMIESALDGDDISIWADLESIPFRDGGAK